MTFKSDYVLTSSYVLLLIKEKDLVFGNLQIILLDRFIIARNSYKSQRRKIL